VEVARDVRLGRLALGGRAIVEGRATGWTTACSILATLSIGTVAVGRGAGWLCRERGDDGPPGLARRLVREWVFFGKLASRRQPGNCFIGFAIIIPQGPAAVVGSFVSSPELLDPYGVA